ncbi:hypothetical protein CPB83DRAFT_846557 [Crepidotus variabilis]|uniref:Uncharacterized protein n=1 Tax=Crepidotus variabilis TaxID=179855 RepID=A0A9P6JUI4_9AGAR|nr:hypothetical protein CPB83DRAFT_846557 [Crepidotus variabilis]
MLARSQNRAAVAGSVFDNCCSQAQLVRVNFQFSCSRRVLQPTNRVRSSCSQQMRLSKTSRDTFASPKVKRAAKSCMTPRLNIPRTLARPTSSDIELEALKKDFAELSGVPDGFVREMVPSMAQSMVAGIERTRIIPTNNTVNPTELRVVFYDSESESVMAPTHILDLSSSSKASSSRQAFLIHQLPFAANCSKFPSMPASSAATPAGNKTSTATLPVVRASVPSPETFSLFQMYLYTKDASALRAALLPIDWSSSMEKVVNRAVVIKGLWSNACVLGTLDNEEMWDVIDECWSVVCGVIEKTTSR